MLMRLQEPLTKTTGVAHTPPLITARHRQRFCRLEADRVSSRTAGKVPMQLLIKLHNLNLPYKTDDSLAKTKLNSIYK